MDNSANIKEMKKWCVHIAALQSIHFTGKMPLQRGLLNAKIKHAKQFELRL